MKLLFGLNISNDIYFLNNNYAHFEKNKRGKKCKIKKCHMR